MTVPLPVVPVVGAGVADCKLLLVVADELELVVVPVVVVALNAVPLDEDLPAYEAAAA